MPKHALMLVAVAAIVLVVSYSPFSTAQSSSDDSGKASEASGAAWEYRVYPVGRVEDFSDGQQRFEHALNRYADDGFVPHMQSGDFLILRKAKVAPARSSDPVPAPTLDADAVESDEAEVDQPKLESVELPELE